MIRAAFGFGAVLALAGCAGIGGLIGGDPLDEVPRLSDLDISEDATSAAIAAPPDQPGFFAGLFGGRDDAAPNDTPDDTPDITAEPDTPADDTAVTPASASPGFLGRLLQRENTPDAAATVTPDTGTDTDGSTVAPGTLLPFGEVGRTCGVRAAALGTRIYAASGYAIYDSASGTTAPRPHYITGFSDGCVRQFTAALVLNGDVGTHEVVRYQTAQARGPYSTVDNAYETLKASVCGAARGTPCGARINQLARNTTFITGYARFTSSPTWVELLLHDGEVLAVGVERE